MWKLICATLFLAGPVLAQDWHLRESDVLFDAEGLQQALSGQKIEYYDGGTSVFGSDGTYSYTYGGGGLWEGHYEVGDAGLVCVTFVTGTLRCDRFVRNDGRLVLLTEKGERFPVRP